MSCVSLISFLPEGPKQVNIRPNAQLDFYDDIMVEYI